MSKPWHGSSNSNVGWCVAGGVAVGAAAVLAAQAIHRRFATRPDGFCPSACGAGAGAGAGAGSDASARDSGQGAPLVRSDVTTTDFQYPRDIRKEERWPEDSPEYKAGYARHNRVKPARPEVEGDIFDRQRCIVGFDQGLIEQQTCFVLGTGGIGQNVALTLARLGVKKIIMLDCDTYDASNLTRQCLGSKADVGRRKVDVAADNIRMHNLRSEVEAVHLDALTGWPTVVELAKQSDVIFNGVDLGAMWDMAVSALGLELGVPVVAGQSYDWLWDTEYYANTPGHRCSHCQKGLKSFADWRSGQAAHFGARPGRDQDRLVARMFGDAAELTLDALSAFYETDRDFLASGPTMRAILSDSLAAATSGASVLTKAQCPAFLDAVFRRSLRRMLPGAISKQTDLSFVPRPAHVDTRFVGSWVCVCLAAGVHMVSMWVADLFSKNGVRDDLRCPSNFTMLLGTSQSGTEIGYHEELQMAKMGVMGLDSLLKEARFHADDPCVEYCVMSQAAAGRSADDLVPL